MNAGTDVIELRGVERRFGDGHTAVTALHPLDLAIGAGQLVAVMGPSGSGKSTLLSLIGGLDQPTSGRLAVLGADITQLGAAQLAELRRRRVGYVFQELNLIFGLTAAENVALPLELDGVPANRARETAVETLTAVGLAELVDRYPDELSGGEQQRVAIARAAAGDRPILLADEPTGALDSHTGEAIMRLLRRHCDAGRTVVLVTHDAAHAAWADRIVFLRDGRLVDEATPAVNPEFAPVAVSGA
jgi:putative ABC transport system ATP-binding protein